MEDVADLKVLALDHLSHRARLTLGWYFSTTNSHRVKEPSGIDFEMVLTDLLADLMHYAHNNPMFVNDFDYAVLLARLHFEAELRGDLGI